MTSAFERKKTRILEALQVPEDDYTDLSPKGSVDEDIRELCDEINALDGFVTTSSCAGRISVFLDGPSRQQADGDQIASSGGKGGGRWLYVSHSPVAENAFHEANGLFKMFGLSEASSPLAPSPSGRVRYVHFKFEPMILHILTSSLSNAQRALTAAQTAGLRESGISSITGIDPTPVVAIRTQGLALESITGYFDEATETVCPMVTEHYLRSLVMLANARFEANAERKKRFQSALLKSPTDEVLDANGVTWEPADQRAARKRAEGLRRREAIKQSQDASRGAEDDALESGDSLSTALLQY